MTLYLLDNAPYWLPHTFLQNLETYAYFDSSMSFSLEVLTAKGGNGADLCILKTE